MPTDIQSGRLIAAGLVLFIVVAEPARARPAGWFRVLDYGEDAQAANAAGEHALALKLSHQCLALAAAAQGPLNAASRARTHAVCWKEKARALRALGRLPEVAAAAQSCLAVLATLPAPLDPTTERVKQTCDALLRVAVAETPAMAALPAPPSQAVIEEHPPSFFVGVPFAAPGFHFLLGGAGALVDDLHFSVHATGLELGITLPLKKQRRLLLQPRFFFQWETLFRSVPGNVSKADTFTMGLGAALHYVRGPLFLEVAPYVGLAFMDADNRGTRGTMGTETTETGLFLKCRTGENYLNYNTNYDYVHTALDLRLAVRVGVGNLAVYRRWIGASVGLFLLGGATALPWKLSVAQTGHFEDRYSAFIVAGPFFRFCFSCIPAEPGHTSSAGPITR